MTIAPEVAVEVLEREIARMSLSDYALRVSPESYEQPAQVIHLLETLQEVERKIEAGEPARVIVEMPPRSSKSTHVSRIFPSWHLGRHPNHGVILASYSDLLATDNGRAVKDYLGHPLYPFSTRLKADARAAGRWMTTDGGGLIASGVGTGLTGWPLPGNLVLVDDPVKGREEAESELTRSATWLWWQETLLTRVHKGGAVVVTGCLTGDTGVLMADGSETALRDIQRGDRIATYDGEALTTSKVTNWINHGPDVVFAIKTKSGRIVRANARHPWLVERNGGISWRRTATLKPGDAILRVTGASGEAKSVPQTAANSPSPARGSATRTTTRLAGRAAHAPRRTTPSPTGTGTSATATRSTSPSTTAFSPSRMASVLSASSRPPQRTPLPTGAGNSASTTTTTPGESAAFSATTAISQLVTAAPPPYCWPQSLTSDVTPDPIVDISVAGIDDVFDIEVERTENFIANGWVSHNTRWHEDDLIGRILNSAGASDWTRLRIPYLAEADDPLHRAEEEPLSLFGTVPSVAKGEISAYGFSALYQQNPTPSGGGVFKKDWMNRRYCVGHGGRQCPKNARALEKGPRWRVVQVADLGGKQGVGHDPSALATWGTDGISKVILDYWSGQEEYAEVKSTFTAKYFEYKPRLMYIEDATWAQPLISDLRRYSGVKVAPVKAEGSKWTRADAASPEFEGGSVILPCESRWLDSWLHQHLSFPNAAHDEAVDTTSMAMKVLRGSMAPPQQQQQSKAARIDSIFDRPARTAFSGTTVPMVG